ncbi:MAG: metabolite traffic protein EboE [Pirellulaceae bacterium]
MSYQLAYCTNVHAGADLEQTRENLGRHALAVKARFLPTGPMGVGLWLAAPAARQLQEPQRLAPFAHWLAESGLTPFTLNGFPYGDFHEPVVKHRVYHPTWWEEDRVTYTLDLITVLDALLPPGMEGSISTLPLAWRHPLPSCEQLLRAGQGLERVARRLASLEAETGRLIYLCLEPEPGCVLQSSEDVVRFFQEAWGNPESSIDMRRYIRVCHDICHGAVMFEDQQEVLARYAAHGIRVGKVQVSSAVSVDFDLLAGSDRQQARETLSSFAEDRYLHQTSVRSSSGDVRFFEDLPLAWRATPAAGHWRVHFHIPIYLDRFGLISTTRDDIGRCLQAVDLHPELRHFEVETYAWSVLPQALRQPELADGIASELDWFADLAMSTGL